MNDRGQYGTRLLRGGSLYSRSPYGGAPYGSAATNWKYHGPRAFHGHEAPTYGRGGLWSRGREAPLGRGDLLSGENPRGQYRSRPTVGGLWHTIDDREKALATFKRDLLSVHGALLRQILHATPENPYGRASDTTIRPDWLAWWKARAVPFFNDFTEWSAARSPGNWTHFGPYIAYGEQFTTDWDVYKRWLDQLIALRKEAEALGVQFQDAGPTPLPTTVVEDVEDAAKKVAGGAADTWKFVKYAAVTALAIGAVVALSSVAQDLRTGRDPAEKYVEMMRRTRARALPSMPMLGGA